MRRLGAVGLGLVVMGFAANARAEDLCERAAPAFPGQACVGTPHGAAFAPDRQRAAQLAAYATAGERSFQTHFARQSTPYVVYEVVDEPQGRAARLTLRGLGLNRTLGWKSHQAQKDFQTGAAQASLVQQMKADGRPQQAIDQFLQQRSTQLDARIDAREASVLPHELVHQLYVEAGWPGVAGDTGGHYAGPGPDWMDELAAILAESDEGANNRRAMFKDLYLNTRPELYGTLAQADLLDLPALLDQTHPIHARRVAAGEPTHASESGTMIVRPTAKGTVDPAVLFYIKDRMVGDFLIAQTGDPAIFGSILDGFRRGQTFDAWLASEGRAKGLAPDRTGLDRQWRDWLRSTLGEPKLAEV